MMRSLRCSGFTSHGLHRHELLVLSRMPLTSALLLCACLRRSCTTRVLQASTKNNPRPAASLHLPGTFVARGELTVLFSCLHAPILWSPPEW